MKARFYLCSLKAARASDQDPRFETNLVPLLDRLAAQPSGAIHKHRRAAEDPAEQFYTFSKLGPAYAFGHSRSDTRMVATNRVSLHTVPMEQKLDAEEVASTLCFIACRGDLLAIAASQNAPRASTFRQFVNRAFKIANVPYQLELHPLHDCITAEVAKRMPFASEVAVRLEPKLLREPGIAALLGLDDAVDHIEIITRAKRRSSIAKILPRLLDTIQPKDARRMKVRGSLEIDGVVEDYIIDGLGNFAIPVEANSPAAIAQKLADLVTTPGPQEKAEKTREQLPNEKLEVGRLLELLGPAAWPGNLVRGADDDASVG